MADIFCDNSVTCGSKLSDANERLVIMRARAKGWRVYEGTSVTGRKVDVVLCSKCLRAPYVKPEPVLDGQIPLWSDE